MTPGLPRPHAAKASLRGRAALLCALFAAALALSGCDKCGDFAWNKPGACRNSAPAQR